MKKEDFTRLLARLRETKGVTYGEGGCQTVPGWSGFNAIATSEDVPQHSTVGYLPVIPASPTELSTVYVRLRKSISVADTLQQEDVGVTLDQAIYAKAQDIVSKHCDEFKRITLRMGGFHVACTFLAVIGLRFGDAGLRDLMVESSLVGQYQQFYVVSILIVLSVPTKLSLRLSFDYFGPSLKKSLQISPRTDLTFQRLTRRHFLKH